MAAAETARLIASMELQDKGFSRGIDGVSRKLGGLETRLGKIGGIASKGVGTAVNNIAKLGVAAGVAAGGLLAASVKQASDLNEEINKSSVVFGAASKSVLEWSKNSANAVGLARAEALQGAGAFGNMFKTIGLADAVGAKFSTNLVQLAADMASFNNEDPSEMLLRLRSGLSGEAEPLRRFGILISAARVEQEAYASGIAKSGEALTEQQKVQARYNLILKDSAVQQGDFARTSGSLANQQRILAANLKNAGATIGTAILPKVAALAIRLNKLITDNQPAIERFAAQLPAAFDKAVAFAEKIPWQAIGEGLKTAAIFAGKLFETFANLPPQAQATILALGGLNKLSGGAVAGIIGELGKGLIKGVLGMTAGVVNLKAAAVTGLPGVGPGVAPAAGKTGGFLGAVKLLGSVTLAGASIFALAEVFNGLQAGFTAQTTSISDSIAEQFRKSSTADLQKSLAAVAQGIADVKTAAQPFGPLGGILVGDTLDDLTAQMRLIEAELARRREEGFTPPGPATGGVSPDEREERAAATAAWLAFRDAARELGKGSPLTALKQTTSGVDAIALAKVMTENVTRGFGPFFQKAENQVALLTSIEATQKEFLAKGDTETAQALQKEIDALRVTISAGNTDAAIIASANARTAMEAAAAEAGKTRAKLETQREEFRFGHNRLAVLLDRNGTDARILAANAARTAMEQKAATLQIAAAVRDRAQTNVIVNVSTSVSAGRVQESIQSRTTWTSGRTLNRYGEQ